MRMDSGFIYGIDAHITPENPRRYRLFATYLHLSGFAGSANEGRLSPGTCRCRLHSSSSDSNGAGIGQALPDSFSGLRVIVFSAGDQSFSDRPVCW